MAIWVFFLISIDWITLGYDYLHKVLFFFSSIDQITLGYDYLHKVLFFLISIDWITLGYDYLHKVLFFISIDWLTLGYDHLHKVLFFLISIDWITLGYDHLHKVLFVLISIDWITLGYDHLLCRELRDKICLLLTCDWLQLVILTWLVYGIRKWYYLVSSVEHNWQTLGAHITPLLFVSSQNVTDNRKHISEEK